MKTNRTLRSLIKAKARTSGLVLLLMPSLEIIMVFGFPASKLALAASQP